MVFTAEARSGALSANVPSKSNSTARVLVTHAAQEIVDVAVAPEPILARERVVGHADELGAAQPGVSSEARELSGLDEAQVVVRAAWPQPTSSTFFPASAARSSIQSRRSGLIS